MRLASQSSNTRPAIEKALEKLVEHYASPRLIGESLNEHISKIEVMDKAAYDRARSIADAIYLWRFSDHSKISARVLKQQLRGELSLLSRQLKDAKTSLS